MQDGKHVILCIDDDEDVLLYLRTVLEANDYLVVTADSAEEGLKVYKKNQPDLIILDLMMEQVDAGTNLVKELKLLGNTVPVYLASSVGDNLNVTTDAAELGLDGVLQKPVNDQQLLMLLKTKLG
jgi:CheY-like chemotaxis protein